MSSINDVAKEAGVSTATVSRTFSAPEALSQHTRRRVLEVADRMGYRPRGFQSARTPARAVAAASDAFGFLFFAAKTDTNPFNDFYAPVMAGAQAEAALLRMHLIVRTAPRHSPPSEMPMMFREQAVAGMLLVGAAPPEVLAAYDTHNIQAVLVDNSDRNGRHDCILSDGFRGAYEAAQHLIGLGHRRLGFVMNEPTAASFRDRRHGFLSALFDAGLAPDPRWMLDLQPTDEVEPHLTPILTASDRPTALVAANDTIAFAVLKACRSLGLDIPGDLSVIGFDDIPFGIHTVPPLTTLRVDKEYMGRLAVRRLQARIEESQLQARIEESQLQARIEESQGASPRREPSIHLTLPVSLVKRETCQPPKA